METFDDFLATMDDPEQRAKLADVFIWVRETFPELNERIAWNQPMFTDHGTFIIAFSVAKAHFAVAPEAVALEQFADRIKESGYTQTKQLFRIKWNQAVDFELLRDIIAFNIQDKADHTSFWR
ncbi:MULTISPECIES: iron chaperone [Exiguobacterium]|uniref:iron chaperone n=1 Tax=Exiguobacterium TaxID=33986 RepID=UPI001BEA76D0|nr:MULTISPECIES: iron chaperone [Exiguobacterium]MCT4783064.1 iron chaperone [Exiguobacterium himgiriensis]